MGVFVKWFDLVCFAGVIQGLFFTVLLIKNQKNRYANRFLAMLAITVSLVIGFPIFHQINTLEILPIFFLYLVCSPLMIPPFFYLYTKFLISAGTRLECFSSGGGKGENYPGATCWLIGIPDMGKGAVIMTNGVKGNRLAMEIFMAIAIKNHWPNVDE